MDSRKNRIRTNIAEEYCREEDETLRTYSEKRRFRTTDHEGKMEVKRGRGRPQTSWLTDINNGQVSPRKQIWLECSREDHSSALR